MIPCEPRVALPGETIVTPTIAPWTNLENKEVIKKRKGEEERGGEEEEEKKRRGRRRGGRRGGGGAEKRKENQRIRGEGKERRERGGPF